MATKEPITEEEAPEVQRNGAPGGVDDHQGTASSAPGGGGIEGFLQITGSRGWNLGHVSPAIYGGLQVGVRGEEKKPEDWSATRVPIPSGLVLIVFVPDKAVNEKAGGQDGSPAAPQAGEEVKRKEAIFS